jgi:CBS domain-containing protein
MKTVREVLSDKGDQVWTTKSDMTVYDALNMMAEKDVGALLVVDQDCLVGIFSERDYARKVILKGKSSRELPVREIMSTKVFYVHPDQTMQDCMALMTDRHIRHLPVLDGGKIIGVISIGDVVKAIISDQQITIEHLERYISGTEYGSV